MYSYVCNINDLNISNYLNDINLNIIFVIPKIFNKNANYTEEYIFQAKNENDELVNGTIGFNHNKVSIEYQTQNNQTHIFTSSITYYTEKDYVVNTIHLLSENNKQTLVESNYGENIPKKDIFKFKTQKTVKQKNIYTYMANFRH